MNLYRIICLSFMCSAAAFVGCSASSDGDDAGGEGGSGGDGGDGGGGSAGKSGGSGGSKASGGSGGSKASGGSGGSKASGGNAGGSAGGGAGGSSSGGASGGSGGAMADFPPKTVPVPPTDGLIMHFSFDEGMGTEVKDKSGANNHGVLVKGKKVDAAAHPTPGPVWVDGLWGKAFNANKGAITDEWVRVASSDSINSTGTNNAVSLAAWVNLEYYNQQWNMLVHRHISLMSSERFAIGINESVTLGYLRHDKTAGSTTLFPKKWIHIAMTYDGSMVRLYENGVEVDAVPSDLGVQTGTEPVTIACGINSPVNMSTMMPEELANEVVHGTIDEVVMYNRALSAEEVGKLVGK